MSMSTKNKLTTWINLEDIDLCEWAFMYLVKVGIYPASDVEQFPTQAWRLQRLKEFKIGFEDSLPNKLIMSAMRKAWKQRRYRKSHQKKKRRDYSFVLDKGVSEALSALAKRVGKPRNKTLELLIEFNYKNVERHKNALKEQKQALKLIEKKAKNEEWFNELYNYVPADKLDRAEEQIKELKEQNENLKKEVGRLKLKENIDAGDATEEKGAISRTTRPYVNAKERFAARMKLMEKKF